MTFFNILNIVLFFTSVKPYSISKRVDVSYGSPAYKYCECGVKNEIIVESSRIIGGVETSMNAYPWMAAIIAFNKRFPQIICGASLINDQYVLSAAHCLRSKYQQSEMKVVLGEHNLCQPDNRTVTFSIEKILQHPDYILSNRSIADLMLVKLSMRVTFNEFIRPICLPKRVKNVETQWGGRYGDTLGWGVTDTLFVSCTLREVSLVIYKPGTCQFNSISSFCAGYPQGQRDTCTGDSGGPFQILNERGKYELIGITSSGLICAESEYPGVYTDVTFALSWIFAETQDSMYSCGVANTIEIGDRIIGGRSMRTHRYPWMVALMDGSRGVVMCGGTLISDRYILTAGHCLQIWKLNLNVTIALGLLDLYNIQEAQLFSDVKLIMHPNFTAGTMRDLDDIGLIKLSKAVRFTENIRPICLPTTGADDVGRMALVAGWGISEKGFVKVPRISKETKVEVISKEKCAKTIVSPFLGRNMFCTYTEGTDACQGDSGGPLVMDRRQNVYELIGIVSWGFGCAIKDSPGVYTNVTHYLDWILSETQDSVYCKNE